MKTQQLQGPIKLLGLSIKGLLVRKLSSWHQYAGEYDYCTKVVLFKVYTNHIDRATTIILCYLKLV